MTRVCHGHYPVELFLKRVEPASPPALLIADNDNSPAQRPELLGGVPHGFGRGKRESGIQSTPGFYWWEIDITYYLLWLMARTGIIWDLNAVPTHVRESHHIDSPS